MRIIELSKKTVNPQVQKDGVRLARGSSRDTVSTEEELRSRVAAGAGGQRQGRMLTPRSCPVHEDCPADGSQVHVDWVSRTWSHSTTFSRMEMTPFGSKSTGRKDKRWER